METDYLYTIYTRLTEAKDNIADEHTKDYEDAIKATQNSIKEKLLARQIIQKFFSSFPALQNDALEAMFDLCEDEDKSVRIAAMKSLPSFCKDLQFVNRVADVMAQMLQLEDPTEQTIANNVFMEILQKNPSTVIKCIFKTIHDANIEQFIRFRCIQFVLSKVKLLDDNLLTTEIQDLMITHVKNTLNGCIADEFMLLMNYLVSTNFVKSFGGQKEVFEIILAQIEIEKEFVPYQTSNNFTNRLVCCVKFIIPFFSAKVESKQLVEYYCDKVLPKWDEIGLVTNGQQYQIALAQQLASMSQFAGTLANPSQQVEQLYDVLTLYMPEAPADTATSPEMPEFNFTVVESLLFAFHALARQCPDFLTGNPTRLKDFRARLLYFSRGVQGCLKVLNLSDGSKVFNAEEKRIREMCPLLLQNITTLVKDLFYTTPIYKCKILLSFTKKEKEEKRQVEKKEAKVVAPVTSKRHVPITYESNGSAQKQRRNSGGGGGGEKVTVYNPPSGKFSQNIHKGRGGFRGGRGRGRGGYRN